MINRHGTKILDLVVHDKELLALLSGIILTAIALLTLAITAGIWYL